MKNSDVDNILIRKITMHQFSKIDFKNDLPLGFMIGVLIKKTGFIYLEIGFARRKNEVYREKNEVRI